jgi:hypothetical protein
MCHLIHSEDELQRAIDAAPIGLTPFTRCDSSKYEGEITHTSRISDARKRSQNKSP